MLAQNLFERGKAVQPRKQHLIDTAYALFNEFGYHATGIDRILAESGVSKATLYKHFRTKDELVVAVLQQRHEQLMQVLADAMAQAKSRGEPAPLAIFDVLNVWFNGKAFFGCNFINASAEYASPGHAIYAFASEHKSAIQQAIEDNLEINGKIKRAEVATQLALLVDGAIVRAHTLGDRSAARIAKKAATLLIKQ